jgi:hypothetical protein
MDYEFVPLQKVSSNGSSFTMGHAIIWQPGKGLTLKLFVSEAAIARDFHNLPKYWC